MAPATVVNALPTAFAVDGPNIVLVHTPVHASWLNQIEVYFSIVQRKLLTPSDFQTLADLKRNVMAFQARYQRAAKPFKWTFTRRDLHALLAKLKKRSAKSQTIAAAQYVTVIANTGLRYAAVGYGNCVGAAAQVPSGRS